ncbi:MAG TPA: DUF6629 family protein [Nocardioidaceae bacterium]|nr:DUF6629 family protein [Nocardioidaceae bacterium]
MCFSAEADLVAGMVVGVVAVDTLRHVRRPAELPIALLPAVFALHQLVEVLVWWSLQDRVSAEVGERAVWVYLILAFGVLPVLAPTAIALLEPPQRARRMGAFVALGCGAALALMYAVLLHPVHASIRGHHIAYNATIEHNNLVLTAYVVATCGAMLVSRHAAIRTWGLLNALAVSVLVWLDQTAVVSLWCVWAAATSVAIAVHLRRSDARHDQLAEVRAAG